MFLGIILYTTLCLKTGDLSASTFNSPIVTANLSFETCIISWKYFYPRDSIVAQDSGSLDYLCMFDSWTPRFCSWQDLIESTTSYDQCAPLMHEPNRSPWKSAVITNVLHGFTTTVSQPDSEPPLFISLHTEHFAMSHIYFEKFSFRSHSELSQLCHQFCSQPLHRQGSQLIWAVPCIRHAQEQWREVD